MRNDAEETRYRLLRDLVEEVLKKQVASKTSTGLQAHEVLRKTALFAFERGVVESINQVSNESQAETSLPQPDKETIKAILWDMVAAGIIVPGSYGEVAGRWPMFTVSRYGQECLSGESGSPYDPDGFVRTVGETSPGISADVLFYVGQSLQCFRRGFLEASTVLLGVAAERVALDLVEAYSTHLVSKPTSQKKFENAIKGRVVAIQLKELLNRIENEKETLPGELKDFETYLKGIGTLIRRYRNQAGHPTGIRIERRAAYTNLQLFAHFCSESHRLARHLEEPSALKR